MNTTKPDDDDPDALYDRVYAQPAAFSQETMYKMEAAYRSDPHGRTRRGALAVLTQPVASLCEKVTESRVFAEALAELDLSIKHYVDYLNAAREAMEAAQIRIMTALVGRDDMAEIIAETNLRAAQADQAADSPSPPAGLQ